jgi:hypothetical protein
VPEVAAEFRVPSPLYRLEASAAGAALRTDLARGLAEPEAAARRARFGPNALEERGGRCPWRLLVDQFDWSASPSGAERSGAPLSSASGSSAGSGAAAGRGAGCGGCGGPLGLGGAQLLLPSELGEGGADVAAAAQAHVDDFHGGHGPVVDAAGEGEQAVAAGAGVLERLQGRGGRAQHHGALGAPRLTTARSRAW